MAEEKSNVKSDAGARALNITTIKIHKKTKERYLMPTGKINLTQMFNVNQNYQRTAFRRTSIDSIQKMNQFQAENTKVSPEDLGRLSQRGNVQDQLSKTIHQRFLDIYL